MVASVFLGHCRGGRSGGGLKIPYASKKEVVHGAKEGGSEGGSKYCAGEVTSRRGGRPRPDKGSSIDSVECRGGKRGTQVVWIAPPFHEGAKEKGFRGGGEKRLTACPNQM